LQPPVRVGREAEHDLVGELSGEFVTEHEQSGPAPLGAHPLEGLVGPPAHFVGQLVAAVGVERAQVPVVGAQGLQEPQLVELALDRPRASSCRTSSASSAGPQRSWRPPRAGRRGLPRTRQ
jgi:hypothetical protein